MTFDAAAARAGEMIKAGASEPATRLLARLLAYDPTHLQSLNLMAIASRQRQDVTAARRVMGWAVSVAPENASLRHNHGLMLRATDMNVEAEAAFAEARRLGFQPPHSPGFAATARIFPDLESWAVAADYKIWRGAPIPPPAAGNPDVWPPGVRWLIGEVARASARPPVLAAAEGMRLIHWRWSPTAKIPRGEELLVPLSRVNGIAWDPFWLARYPFIRNVTTDGSGCVVDTRPFAPAEIHLEGEYFLLGGKNNYGHWLADFLPNLWYLQAAELPRHVKIATTGLNAWQKDTLSCFDLGREIVELDPPSEQRCTLYAFDRVWTPGELPLAFRFAFIRAAFAAAGRQPDNPAGPKRIFVSRALTQGPGRVANEAEIQQALAAAGFAVVNGEALNTREKARLFGQAEIIVVGPGSTNFNYFAFANDQCQLINLWPAAAFNDAPLDLLKGALWFSVPFLDRTQFVLGDALDPAAGRAHLDAPAHYPIEQILAAVERCGPPPR